MSKVSRLTRQPPIDLVVAMTNDYVIGFSNTLPWRLSADLKRFRKITTGNAVVMGRRTYESIGRPLPRRTNVVVSRRKNLRIKGCTVASSLRLAVGKLKRSKRVFVIGGGQLYSEALPLSRRIYLTLIELDQTTREQPYLFDDPIGGDAFFPKLNASEWKISKRGRRRLAREKGAGFALENEDYPSAIYFRFLVLERRKRIRGVEQLGDRFSESFGLSTEPPDQRKAKGASKAPPRRRFTQPDLFGP
jgi:dihydrofolate reductase